MKPAVMRGTYRYTWKEKVEGGKVMVVREGNPSYYKQTFHSRRTDTEYVGEFDVEIDVGALVQDAVNRAAYNRSGKARMLKGLIIARRVSRTKLAESVVERPIPAGFKILEPAS